MSNWIAAPLAIIFFLGFIFVMKNKDAIVEKVKEKLNK